MGIMNECTLKFLMGQFLRGSYGEGFAIFFGVVLGCKGCGGEKNFLGPKKFFQVQAFQTEL